MATSRRKIHVRGLVQGVGFRPYVWRLAKELGLVGHVLNDGEGVAIEAWGTESALDRFIGRLTRETPLLARIESVDWERLPIGTSATEFRIVESTVRSISTGIIPDAATCPQCLAEIFDPADRRFRYAFTNCTQCGPRFSIVGAIPYDRASTSMRSFPMCEACTKEYEDPNDRRFHAETNACPDCGPHIWLEDGNGWISCDDPIAEIAKRLKEGAIAAIKGIGGFHLACDAMNHKTVGNLRRRKRRPAKPFALMARDLGELSRFCTISEDERELLTSPAAPIVLLKNTKRVLPPSIAPDQTDLGFMLPYTPLHHLLMAKLDGPIVLTSGNRSEEPQATSNEDARDRLADIADCWLMHDRDIVSRLDDSVMRIDHTGPQVLRRARGFTPGSILLAPALADAPRILAMGGELKSTFCLLRDSQAIVSQHIGDLEEATTYGDYRNTLRRYRDLFHFDPEIIVVDRHSDYLSSQWGRAMAAETGARVVEVQHHQAHLASCLAEHRIEPGDDLSLGIILDGLGLGLDGTIWGGEFLVGGYAGFQRAGHFLPVALPGGRQCMKQPWRNTVAHLRAALGEQWHRHLKGTHLGQAFDNKPTRILTQMIRSGLNAPLSSSAGRLFDAVAGAASLCFEQQSYEGQAAMELEALALPYLDKVEPYPTGCAGGADQRILSWEPMWCCIIRDLKSQAPSGHIAARFHLGLIAAITAVATTIAAETGTQRIVLSGGVMQNRILVEGLHRRLTEKGFEVLTHANVPANDGGLSLGQAVIAAATARQFSDWRDG